jgi:hypothetical protein
MNYFAGTILIALQLFLCCETSQFVLGQIQSLGDKRTSAEVIEINFILHFIKTGILPLSFLRIVIMDHN